MTVEEVTNNKQQQQGSSSRRRQNREAAAAAQRKTVAQTENKDRAVPARRENNKGNFVTRFFRAISNYFASTRAEIQKVTWPTRQEALRLSGIVLAVTIISSIALGLLDFLYGELFRVGLSAPIIFGVAAIIIGALVIGATLVTRRT